MFQNAVSAGLVQEKAVPSLSEVKVTENASPGATAAKPQSFNPAIGKLKTTVRIPTSLKSAQKMAAGQQAAAAEEQQAGQPEIIQPQQVNLPDREYTREELLAAWQKYAEQVKAAGRQGEFIVLKETPDLPGEHLVHVRITNSVQKDYFDKARPAAQSFLRQTLQNSRITLDCIMVKEEEGKRLYTGQEKFSYLLKKYPHLQVLKERLGLEADF